MGHSCSFACLRRSQKIKDELASQSEATKVTSNPQQSIRRDLSQIDADCVEVAKFVLSWAAVALRLLTAELAGARFLGMNEWEELEDVIIYPYYTSSLSTLLVNLSF